MKWQKCDLGEYSYSRRMVCLMREMMTNRLMLMAVLGDKLLFVPKTCPWNIFLVLLPHLPYLWKIHGVIRHLMLLIPIPKLGNRQPCIFLRKCVINRLKFKDQESMAVFSSAKWYYTAYADSFFFFLGGLLCIWCSNNESYAPCSNLQFVYMGPTIAFDLGHSCHMVAPGLKFATTVVINCTPLYWSSHEIQD